MTDGSTTPAGWYPAPHAGGEQRYWDGAKWLDVTPEQASAQAQAQPQAPAYQQVDTADGAPAAAGYPGAAPTAVATATSTLPPGSDLAQGSKKPLNVIGLIALIAAGLGFIFACIPGALVVGWILLPIGFVLGIVSLFMKGRGKALGIAGLIVSIIGTIVGFVVFFAVVSVAFDEAFDSGGDTVATQPSAEAEESEAAESEAAEAPAAAAEGTRENPYPIGTVLENEEWRVVVNSVTLAATDAVLAVNEFNEAPPAGSEYILVNYSATYLGSDPEGAIPAVVIVEYVTPEGTTVNSYDNFAVAPDPVFDSISTLYTDGTATGNVVFAVPSATAGAGVLAIDPGFLTEKVFVAVQ